MDGWNVRKSSEVELFKSAESDVDRRKSRRRPLRRIASVWSSKVSLIGKISHDTGVAESKIEVML